MRRRRYRPIQRTTDRQSNNQQFLRVLSHPLRVLRATVFPLSNCYLLGPEMPQTGCFARFCFPMERICDCSCDVSFRHAHRLQKWLAER
jgi:hypothetical protein